MRDEYPHGDIKNLIRALNSNNYTVRSDAARALSSLAKYWRK